jgi:N-formylglutamate amidohydrolase
MTDILSIARAEKPLPLVFDSPHSGTIYPDDFGYGCDFHDLVQAEDKYVDELFSCAPAFGAAFQKALFPRSYIDVNRAVDDIDLNLLDEDWPFDDIQPSARSDAGIGLIRRLVKPGMPVYNRFLSAEEIAARIERYYKPYHASLEKLLNDAYYNFGQVWHINCHSMPSASAFPKHGVMGLAGHKPKPIDFVLGDRDGASCDIDFTHATRKFLESLGYSVSINDPFKGVELVRRYSQPTRGRHSLQIEINKALYMDEETHLKNSDFKALQADIEKLVTFIAGYVSAQLVDLAAD